MCRPNMNNAGPAIANKIFHRGTLPVFKTAGTSKHDFSEWIKLTLYFENPAIRRGKLFLDFAPLWPEHYMTGVMAVGFGLHATLIAKYRRYMKHEFLVKAILGRETYDHYSGSPVLNEYPYKHLSTETIRSALNKFVGNMIAQSYPTTLLQYRKFGQPSSIDSKLQTVSSDGVQITHPADDKNSDGEEDELDEMNDGDDDDNNNNNNNLEKCDSPAAAAVVGRHPTLRIKQCHSIELLQVDDAVVQMRIITDGLFSCRALVRDLGLELGCHAVIDQLHLKSIGPFSDEQALHKHELHVEQIERALTENAERSQRYYSKMKDQYPDASSTYRFI